jgi:hypothetical protein
MIKSKSVPFPDRGIGGRPILSNAYIRADYVPEYVNLRPGARILTSPHHPFYFKTIQQYSNAPREGLWWYVQPNVFEGDKKCLRARRGRRVKVAILEALRERGFDKNGKAIQQDGKPSLKGSMEVLVSAFADKASWEQLKQTGRDLVNAVANPSPIRALEKNRRAERGNNHDRGRRGRAENSQGTGIRALRMTDANGPRKGPIT